VEFLRNSFGITVPAFGKSLGDSINGKWIPLLVMVEWYIKVYRRTVLNWCL